MQAVLDAVDGNSRAGIRDMVLLLLYNTGARVSEVVELKLHDLRLNGADQIHLLGKGNKHRSCPLWLETVTALQAYLEQRAPQEPGNEYVFLNAVGAPITRFGIRYITKKYGKTAQSQCPSVETKKLTHMLSGKQRQCICYGREMMSIW